MFHEQAQLEAYEDFASMDSAASDLLERELKSEDVALTELGVDLDSAYASAQHADSTSLAEVEAEDAMEADLDAESDVMSATEAEVEETQRRGPIIIAVPVRTTPREYVPAINQTNAQIISEPAPIPPRVDLVAHPFGGVSAVVTQARANRLLTRLYDKDPLSPRDIAAKLPQTARTALFKVLSKSNDTDVQISITASFLAAFTTDNLEAETEAQEKSAALLEASDEKTAMANTDMNHKERKGELPVPLPGAADDSFGASLAETEAAAETETETEAEAETEAENTPAAPAPAAAAPAPAPAATGAAPAAPAAAAGAPVAASPQVLNQVDGHAETLDTGVSALRKYADVLEGEAVILSKKLEELARIHKGSIFKAMDRGPVGRRETPKDRRQVFTNGMRSWEADAASESMRGRRVSQNEADRIYTIDPIPK